MSEAALPQRVRDFFGAQQIVGNYAAAEGYRPGEAYVLERFLHPGGKLLEIGCGAGRVTFLLAHRFPGMDALDIVPEMVEAARMRQAQEGAPVRLFVGDATALQLPDDGYDNVIFTYNGIEAIPTAELREKALREIHRVLRPGGRFVFSTKSLFTRPYLVEQALKPRVRQLLRRLGMRYPHEKILPFGKIVWREEGRAIELNTSNPFTMKRLLKRIGFDLTYFNAESRLASGKVSESFWANFGEWDQFFVCEKPLGARRAA
jgi:ubiquinone/menaquinone biosynthesis C-methylase UbiE